MSEHTKGKMTVKEYGGHDSLYLNGKCWCSGVSKEISHRLVKCWNSHDKLLEVCKSFIEEFAPNMTEAEREAFPHCAKQYDEAKAAIAEAQPSRQSEDPTKLIK